jgi:uncharacterized damage-inducible protein DinB
MSTREFFAERLKAEIPGFAKVLRALPADPLDYKPHEKNTSAGSLAWQIGTEIGTLQELFGTGDINYVQGPTPASLDEIVAFFEKHAEETLAQANAVGEERWNGPGRFLWGGQTVWEATVAEIAWGFLFDMIHHRGQLTAYLRPMGGKVPAVYGPSADDQG